MKNICFTKSILLLSFILVKVGKLLQGTIRLKIPLIPREINVCSVTPENFTFFFVNHKGENVCKYVLKN